MASRANMRILRYKWIHLECKCVFVKDFSSDKVFTQVYSKTIYSYPTKLRRVSLSADK